MGGKIQNRRKSSKRPKTNASINACKIDPEYDTITQVAIYRNYCKSRWEPIIARSGLPNRAGSQSLLVVDCQIHCTRYLAHCGAAYQTVYCHSIDSICPARYIRVRNVYGLDLSIQAEQL